MQDARTPLVSNLASNTINVILAPLLIFVWGYGVKGAAAAIVIAQVQQSIGLGQHPPEAWHKPRGALP